MVIFDVIRQTPHWKAKIRYLGGFLRKKSPACGFAHAGLFEGICLFWIKQVIRIGIHPRRGCFGSRHRHQHIGLSGPACISKQGIRGAAGGIGRNQGFHLAMSIAINANRFLARPDASFASHGIDRAARCRGIKYQRIIRIRCVCQAKHVCVVICACGKDIAHR